MEGAGDVLRVTAGEPGLVPAREDSQQLEAVACPPDGEDVAPVVGLPGPVVEQLADSSVAPGTGEGS